MNTSTSKPPFTTRSRLLCLFALLATAGAMYWVITNTAIDSMKKLLAGGGVLIAGLLLIAAGVHFSEGRHRK